MSLPVSSNSEDPTVARYQRMYENFTREALERHHQDTDRLNRLWQTDKEALQIERGNSARWRATCSNGSRVIAELRRDITDYRARLDQADSDNRNLRDSLQRIELLIGNIMPQAEIAFRSSCIKYTSPAYWVFSIYDAISMILHNIYQVFIKAVGLVR